MEGGSMQISSDSVGVALKPYREFFIRPVLPLLPSGKVNKVELRKEIK
jgi:hypothetical protein